VKQLLSAAAGLDQRRGDVIAVQRMKIEAAELAKTQETAMADQEKRRQRETIIQTALRSSLSLLAAGMVFMTALVVMRQFRHLANVPYLQRPGPTAEPDSASAEATALPGQGAERGPAPYQGSSPPLSALRSTPRDGDRRRTGGPDRTEASASLQEELRQIAQEDAPAVADRLLTLIQEGR